MEPVEKKAATFFADTENAHIVFTVDKTSISAYNRIDFYLGHNVYNARVMNKGQVDSHFEFISFDGESAMGLNLRNIILSTRRGLNYNFNMDVCQFTFKYKGHAIRCKVDQDAEQPITVTHEDKHYSIITLAFPTDAAAGLLFEDFIKSAYDYADKYMLDCEASDNKLSIYINEEGYWERVLSRKKRDLETIYLPKKDKDSMIADITKFLEPETKNLYEMIGRTHKRVYLFEGLPGTGKTSFIAALASYFDYDIAIITFTDNVTDGKLFRLLKNVPDKTFLVLEDIDVLFEERKKNDSHKNKVTFSGVLNALDGITTKDGFMCFITTNHKNLLDPALLRPGRIDKQIEFNTVTMEQIGDIFIKFMGTAYKKEDFTAFYEAYKDLRVDVTMSLIQEYLFNYLDSPADAIKNVKKIKELYNASCKNDSSGKLYS